MTGDDDILIALCQAVMKAASRDPGLVSTGECQVTHDRDRLLVSSAAAPRVARIEMRFHRDHHHPKTILVTRASPDNELVRLDSDHKSGDPVTVEVLAAHLLDTFVTAARTPRG
jgi:hypothetical protein